MKEQLHVYVRKINEKYFNEEATVVGSTSTTNDLVGVSVSVYNDTILVAGNTSGKSYVLKKVCSNTWDEIKILSVGPQDRTSMIATENNLLIGDFSNNKAFLYKKLYNHNSTSSAIV